MFNCIWVYPHLAISNIKELNLFYNAINLSVFFKSLFLLYLSIAFLILGKSNFSMVIFFIFFFKYPIFEIIKLSTVNNGLLNPLAFWHPVHLAVLFVLFSFTSVFKINNFYRLLIVITIFVFLGSWWSSQEVLWHGWWNWDGVENTLLNLTVYLFILSHTRLNLVQKSYFFKLVLFFVYIYFFILNKTNIFKSIHSFTTSVHAQLSYNNFVYIKVYFLLLLYHFKRFKFFFFYNLFLTAPFYVYICMYGSVIFSKMDFFLHLNLFLLFILYVSRFGFLILLIFTLLYNFNISVMLMVLFYLSFWKLKNCRFIHNVYLIAFIFFSNIITKQNFVFFDWYFCNDRFLFNFSTMNKILIGFDLFTNYLLWNNSSVINTIFKNLNLTRVGVFQDCLWTGCWNTVNSYKFFSLLIFFLFLVTKVFYLKQKPRYNYYK